MRVMEDHFQDSLKTVSRHFSLTLKVICKLAKDLFHLNSSLPYILPIIQSIIYDF